MSSYAALLKMSKKVLERKIPFALENILTGEKKNVTHKTEKDAVIEEMFKEYKQKQRVIYIFSIYEPTSSKSNLKNDKNV